MVAPRKKFRENHLARHWRGYSLFVVTAILSAYSPLINPYLLQFAALIKGSMIQAGIPALTAAGVATAAVAFSVAAAVALVIAVSYFIDKKVNKAKYLAQAKANEDIEGFFSKLAAHFKYNWRQWLLIASAATITPFLSVIIPYFMGAAALLYAKIEFFGIASGATGAGLATAGAAIGIAVAVAMVARILLGLNRAMFGDLDQIPSTFQNSNIVGGKKKPGTYTLLSSALSEKNNAEDEDEYESESEEDEEAFERPKAVVKIGCFSWCNEVKVGHSNKRDETGTTLRR